MQSGFVVVVTEALEDAAELFDFIELMSDRGARRLPQLIVADAARSSSTTPRPSVLEVCAWARLKGLRVPFVVLTDQADEPIKELARALGGVELTAPRNLAA